jgi:hypothetical protein
MIKEEKYIIYQKFNNLCSKKHVCVKLNINYTSDTSTHAIHKTIECILLVVITFTNKCI